MKVFLLLFLQKKKALLPRYLLDAARARILLGLDSGVGRQPEMSDAVVSLD